MATGIVSCRPDFLDHRRVMKQFSGRMHNISSATWQSERFVLADAWAEAARRRAADDA